MFKQKSIDESFFDEVDKNLKNIYIEKDIKYNNDKINLIDELISKASLCEEKGLNEEAEFITKLIEKAASGEDFEFDESAEKEEESFEDENEEFEDELFDELIKDPEIAAKLKNNTISESELEDILNIFEKEASIKKSQLSVGDSTVTSEQVKNAANYFLNDVTAYDPKPPVLREVLGILKDNGRITPGYSVPQNFFEEFFYYSGFDQNKYNIIIKALKQLV
jgi:hypothetical protein